LDFHKMGVRGHSPLQASLSISHWEGKWQTEAHGRPWAVLAMLLQTARREFACCASLGEHAYSTYGRFRPTCPFAFAQFLGRSRQEKTATATQTGQKSPRGLVAV